MVDVGGRSTYYAGVGKRLRFWRLVEMALRAALARVAVMVEKIIIVSCMIVYLLLVYCNLIPKRAAKGALNFEGHLM